MEINIKVPTGAERVAVLGAADRNLKMLRETLGVAVAAREDRVTISGERTPVAIARRVVERLIESARDRRPMSRQQVLDLISDEAAHMHDALEGKIPFPEGEEGHSSPREWDGRLHVYAAGRPVRPRTPNQERYLEAIRLNDLVFAIGPAGTGKTYLAVAAAVHLLKLDLVRKVVLARPAVEAGEKLGFLPGGIEAKVNPYLRPLLDALHDMVDFPTIRRFMDNDVVEVVPLAFMRGRTLNNAVVILDEAQNTTRGQMKMFLTRLGHGSKMIVTGDVTQTDLPDPRDSGLIDAVRRLGRAPGVGLVTLERSDVVRHPLVQRVIDAYGEQDTGPTGQALERAMRETEAPDTDVSETDAAPAGREPRG